MNALLDTYGKTLVACIVASIMILFSLSLKDIYYREIYPQHNESSTVGMYDLEQHIKNYPKLVVNDDYVYEEKVTIKRNNPDYDLRLYKNSKTTDPEAMAKYKEILANYKKFVTAERTHEDSTPIDVQVFGAEAIDVTRTGRVYALVFVAKNDLGLMEQKRIFVLIN